MDIAATGLVPLSLPGVDRGRPARASADQSKPLSQSAERENSSRNSSREGLETRSETIGRSIVDINRATSSTQGSLSERESVSSQSGGRQFSLSAAIQAFEENEALIAPEGQQRQVSGIIDEFV
jgi:hypothetical protein